MVKEEVWVWEGRKGDRWKYGRKWVNKKASMGEG